MFAGEGGRLFSKPFYLVWTALVLIFVYRCHHTRSCLNSVSRYFHTRSSSHR